MESFAESKYRGSGQKRIVVPVFRRPDGPITASSSTFSPPSKAIAYSLPPRLTRTSRRLDSALTTETPTPCSPPENR